ncbi:type II toxin-antitoxin system VapC family toxin [bacterium]|nr:MAG: type II toxin-antitoxin system VapC family toxin [bacterium]
MSFLFDTNIFLEVLLGQEKKKICKELLSANIENLYMSDFSLHSIGVILLKQKKPKVFEEFLSDVLKYSMIVSLPKDKYIEVTKISQKFNLDFDDSYQTAIAQEFNLRIATMDRDFIKVVNIIQVDII